MILDVKDAGVSGIDIVTTMNVGEGCTLTKQLGNINDVLDTMKESLQQAIVSGNFTTELKKQATIHQASSMAAVTVSGYSITKQSDTTTSSSSHSSNNIDIKLIIGIAIGAFLAIVAVFIAYGYLTRKRSTKVYAYAAEDDK